MTDESMTPQGLVALYQDDENPPSGVLEGLDTIDWSNLRHAHGAATDVPALLKAALSPEIEHREFAISLLFETIWHQGTVYEASAYAVPFLYRMLESPTTPNKSGIAQLLASLADGHSYLEVHATGAWKTRWREILSKKGDVLETELSREIGWVDAVRTAIGKRLQLLYPYLDDENAVIRTYIATALAFYAEYAHEIVPVLERAASAEEDNYALEEMNLAIAKLRPA